MATTSGLSSSAQNLTWRFLQAQMLGMHGTVAANFAVDRADLLLAIGVRFDDRVTGKLEAFARRARIVHIDIDPAEINKNKHSHNTVCADARPSLQARRGCTSGSKIGGALFTGAGGYECTIAGRCEQASDQARLTGSAMHACRRVLRLYCVESACALSSP